MCSTQRSSTYRRFNTISPSDDPSLVALGGGFGYWRMWFANALRDRDGSATGYPGGGWVLGDVPALATPDCEREEEWNGYRCPADKMFFLKLEMLKKPFAVDARGQALVESPLAAFKGVKLIGPEFLRAVRDDGVPLEHWINGKRYMPTLISGRRYLMDFISTEGYTDHTVDFNSLPRVATAPDTIEVRTIQGFTHPFPIPFQNLTLVFALPGNSVWEVERTVIHPDLGPPTHPHHTYYSGGTKIDTAPTRADRAHCACDTTFVQVELERVFFVQTGRVEETGLILHKTSAVHAECPDTKCEDPFALDDLSPADYVARSHRLAAAASATAATENTEWAARIGTETPPPDVPHPLRGYPTQQAQCELGSLPPTPCGDGGTATEPSGPTAVGGTSSGTPTPGAEGVGADGAPNNRSGITDGTSLDSAAAPLARPRPVTAIVSAAATIIAGASPLQF